MMDWPLSDGRSVRIEVEPTYCAHCGKQGPYVPRENTTWAFWLCQPCADTCGEIAGTYMMPDEEFNRKVEVEMLDRFGRVLTYNEAVCYESRGLLGRSLELLIKESPYKPQD
jgi:hypothetical protein